MREDLIPIRWPGAWKDPATLSFINGTAINCLIMDRGNDLGRLADRAKRDGLVVVEAASPPAAIAVIDGEWPGIKLSASGDVDTASAGPTGNPWIDSNGWKIRLTAALHPERKVWIAANPKNDLLSTGSYVISLADAALHGGYWIISLDDRLSAGILAQRPEALETWKQLAGSAGFFAAHKEWSSYPAEAVMGIISDFAGKNEFLSHEILNLTARANQTYRIIPKSGVSQSSFQGLKAVLYADAESPAEQLQKQILEFVESGGMLITGSPWSTLSSMAPAAAFQFHPRYDLRTYGKGKVAVAKESFDDPYMVANDSVVLISHRHDLLRFWNGGALSAHYAMDPGRKRAVVQMLFYASRRIKPTVWIAGKYRNARLWMLEQAASQNIEMKIQQNGVELHLPQISQYAAVELEV
jgi:hypothetical protein